MSPRQKLVVLLLLVVVVVAGGVGLSGTGGLLIGSQGGPGRTSDTGQSAGPGPTDGDPSGGLPTAKPSPTPRPAVGGTELFGFLPYWEMNGAMASYLESVPLDTIALFSVTARANGAVDDRPTGHGRITGGVGRRIIADAHGRGARVELVFTSFGADRNGRFFGRLPVGAAASPAPSTASPPPAPPPWRRTVPELVALAVDLGVDGINVDVELLDELDRDAYGQFLAALGVALRAAIPGAQVSVATEAGPRGVGNAVEAIEAAVERVFLMGYDYHWSGSQPGASAPIDRSDGIASLRWSIDRYVEAGVPRDRILLGLPLYGMSWRTLGPDRTAPVLGSGVAWIPNRHADVFGDPGFRPARDPLEHSEFFVRPDGGEWLITYFDSPATLRAKLALARDNGLAGGGFWALGYERGLPGYRELMADFRAGRVDRAESPTRPTSSP